MTNPNSWNPREKEEIIQELKEAFERGEVRERISCAEARRGWFAMARRMYVGNDSEPDIPLDYEIGAHIAQCPTHECQALARAYWELLRPSQSEDAQALSVTLDILERQISASSN